MIKGGYYIKARKIQESDIAFAPPHVREIWDWLLKEANHSDNEKMNRGQTYRTYKDIQDGLKWFIGYRKMTYSKSQCETAMKWLTKHEMITTTKTTRGMLITVCNYDYYQDPKNYENHKETDTRTTTKPQPPDAINKNDKKERYKEWLNESSNERYKLFVEWFLAGDFQNCMKLDDHLDETRFMKISSFSNEQIKQTIDNMENHKLLTKKYTSFYRTLNNWLKR